MKKHWQTVEKKSQACEKSGKKTKIGEQMSQIYTFQSEKVRKKCKKITN